MASVKNKIRKIIKNIIPYGIVVNRQSQKLYDFMNKFDNFNVEEYTPNENNIQEYNVIAVHGTGGSGSGALMDFMREIDDNACLGKSQPWAKVHKRGIPIEFDILRLAGGLLDMSKLCDLRNYFVADALLHNSIDLFNFNLQQIKPYITKEAFERLENAVLYFFHKQVAFIIEGDSMIMNYHLYYSKNQISNRYRAYWPTMIDKEDFLFEVQRLLCVFFSVLFDDKKNITLVHPFADTGYRLNQMKGIIPNIKLLIITRNDCDVYVQGLILKWNMWYNVDQFIKRKAYLNEATIVPDGLHVKFEDLVCNYAETRRMILNYINIPESQHHSKTIFDPSISIQNVGLHRKYPEYIEDCIKIVSSLK